MKKNISILLFTLLCSFPFTSCNTYNNDLPEENSDNEIIFEANINSTKDSRAVKLSTKNITTFSTYGFYNGINKVNNVTYTKNGTVWKGSKTVIWANGAMNFYAISPSFDISTSKLFETMVEPRPSFEYTVPTNVNSEQVDVLYSSILNIKKSTNSGKVIFSFKPGMHYFSFIAQNTIGTDYKVFVKKIIIHNMIHNGTFKFGSMANSGDWTAKNGVDALYDNDVIVFDNPIEITTTRTSITGDEYFVVMPQTITRWDTTSELPVSIETANQNKNWYVEIVGQIIKTNSDGTQTYLLGNPDNTTDPNHPQYESVYFPQVGKVCKIGIGSSWIITFNGGYNKDGELYMEHLDEERGGDNIDVKVAETFPSSIDVEEWTPYYEDIEL